MKLFLSLLLMFCCLSFSFAQPRKFDNHRTRRDSLPDSLVNKKKNMIGLDATYFLRQFFPSNSFGWNYYPVYAFSYRRFIKSGIAVRAHAGGYSSKSRSEKDDSLIKKSEYNYFDFALGAEINKNMGKRWGYFFGLDVIGGFNKSYSRSPGILTTQWSEYTNTQQYYGGAILVGISLKLNSRISLATEGSFSVRMRVTKNHSISAGPGYYYESNEPGSVLETNFNVPVSIFFRFRF